MKSITLFTSLIVYLLFTFDVKAKSFAVQSEPADDFIGTYNAHDTTITYDGVGNIVATNIRDYVFTVTKVDSNHIAMVNFDECSGTMSFVVSTNTFALENIGTCSPICTQSIGNKAGNILYYQLNMCFGAPIDMRLKGVATKMLDNISKPLLNGLTAFPNPSKDKVFFHFTKEQAGIAQITCLDMQGKQLVQEKINFSQGLLEVAIPYLAAGFYMFEIQTENNSYKQRILITDTQ